MRKFMAATAALLTISLGALGIAALNPFGGAGASTPSTTTTPASTPAAGGAATGPRGAGVLQKVLADLVAKGTITQSQSDAITAALKAEVKTRVGTHPAGKGGKGGKGRKGVAMRARRGGLALAAKTIGITPQELRADLKNHQSIAAVATSKGVSPSTVIAALVKAGSARIDKVVANHKLTTEQATKLKARLTTAVTKSVNATH